MSLAIMLDNGTLLVPYLSIKPRLVTLFYRKDAFQSTGEKDNRAAEESKTLNVVESKSEKKQMPKNVNYGFLSEKAQKQIRTKINWLVDIATKKEVFVKETGKKVWFKINFITLTLPAPQMHTDSELKNLGLNHFLTVARKKWNLKLYLWKAEKQKNGNLHFHITTDVFVHYSELKDEWNKILDKLGYIEAYRNAQIEKYASGWFPNTSQFTRKDRQGNEKPWRSVEIQLAAYKKAKAENFSNPNSTDVHAVENIKNLAAYLSEYFAKSGLSIEEEELIKEKTTRISDLQERIQGDIGIIEDYQKRKIRSLAAEREADMNKRIAEIETIAAELDAFKDRLVEGRIWYASSELSRCKLTVEAMSDEYHEDIVLLTDFLTTQNKVITDKFFTVMLADAAQVRALGAKTIAKVYHEYIAGIRKRLKTSREIWENQKLTNKKTKQHANI